MITLKNVKTPEGQIIDHEIPSIKVLTIDGQGELLLLPGLIDPHAYLGSPSDPNWDLAIQAAVKGGITTILDIPNPFVSFTPEDDFTQIMELTHNRLMSLNIPLHYSQYFTINRKETVEKMEQALKLSAGIAILVDSSCQDPLDEAAWDKIFQLAAWKDLAVAVNLTNENTWHKFESGTSGSTVLDRALYYTERSNARLYVLNIKTPEEIDLIEKARKKALLIYAETTPQHLFPQESSNAHCLWKAIDNGTIDTLGTGYHLRHEKECSNKDSNPHLSNPSLYLPLLLNAYHQGKISIENIIRMTRINIQDIFVIENDQSAVLVDLKKEQSVQLGEDTRTIKGWPLYTIIQGQVYTSVDINIEQLELI